MRVILTRRARENLRQIALYIARDNPDRAMSFVDELHDAALHLGEMLRAFPLVPRFEAQGVRRRAYRGYGILYVIEEDRLVVYRVLGPGQDVDGLLGLN